jgi:hypothetical protein
MNADKNSSSFAVLVPLRDIEKAEASERGKERRPPSLNGCWLKVAEVRGVLGGAGGLACQLRN